MLSIKNIAVVNFTNILKADFLSIPSTKKLPAWKKQRKAAHISYVQRSSLLAVGWMTISDYCYTVKLGYSNFYGTKEICLLQPWVRCNRKHLCNEMISWGWKNRNFMFVLTVNSLKPYNRYNRIFVITVSSL